MAEVPSGQKGYLPKMLLPHSLETAPGNGFHYLVGAHFDLCVRAKQF